VCEKKKRNLSLRPFVLWSFVLCAILQLNGMGEEKKEVQRE
jgi:hypothetical protein